MNTEPFDEQPASPPLRLGFARGVMPNKWARRWALATPHRQLKLVPLPLSGKLPRDEESCDATIVRETSGEEPRTTDPGQQPCHTVKLYTEGVALVVGADHELAEDPSISVDELSLVSLLDYPGHLPAWPVTEPWADTAHRPAHVGAALDLVATGIGAILLPQPLARHLTRKTEHAVLPVTGEIAGTAIWVTWSTEADTPDVQQLIGVLRGRTARSSRPAFDEAEGTPDSDGAPATQVSPPKLRGAQPPGSNTLGSSTSGSNTSGSNKGKKASLKKSPPKNSRGAQLAAAKEAKKRRNR